MLPVGFEPQISADEQPLTYVLDRAATGTGYLTITWCNIQEDIKLRVHRHKNHKSHNVCEDSRL